MANPNGKVIVKLALQHQESVEATIKSTEWSDVFIDSTLAYNHQGGLLFESESIVYNDTGRTSFALYFLIRRVLPPAHINNGFIVNPSTNAEAMP